MDSENYTEAQLHVRYRIGYRSLILTFFLVLANGLVTTRYLWATPLIQALAILLPPSLYFITLTIHNNAYFQHHVKHPFYMGIFCLLIGGYSLFSFIRCFLELGTSSFLVDGQLAGNSGQVLIAFFFLYLGLLIVLKRHNVQSNS